MTAVVDAVSSHATVNAGSSSTSWTHTPVGTPSGVVVGVVSRVNTTQDGTDPTGATYGGQALTKVGTFVDSATSHVRVTFFYLASPLTGAQTVAVTMPDTTSGFTPFAVTVVGDARQLPGALATGTGNSTLASVTPANVPADAIVIAAFGSGTALAGFTAGGQGANVVQIFLDNTGSFQDAVGDYRIGQFGSGAMTHAVTTGAWAGAAIVVTAGQTKPSFPRRMPLGA